MRGIQLCCDRDGLLFGHALACRALTMSLAEPSQFELTLRFEGADPDLSPDDEPWS